MPYNIGIEKTVEGGFDDVVAKIEAALKSEGFGILTRIDVKATLKEKLDIDFKNYVILGACSPSLAHKALSLSDDIGLLLPCNVIVYEKEAGTQVVSAINPEVMENMLPGIDLSEVSDPASQKLKSAIGKI